MSTDTTASAPSDIFPTHTTTAQLLARAERDTDPVSMYCDGTSFADTQRAIFVVKGSERIAYLHALLVRQGMLTEGKGVASDAGDAPTDHKSRLARLLYELWRDGILSEQQCAKRWNTDLVTMRRVLDAYAYGDGHPGRDAAQAAAAAPPPILKGTGIKAGDGFKDTTKVGEVVYAWNAEMPAPYAPGQYPRVGNDCGWTAGTDQYRFEPATVDEVRALFDGIVKAAAPQPLTPAQRRRLWDNSPVCHKGAATTFASFERIVTLVESVHRIGVKP